jgi:RNA-binding protein YlmH
MYQVKNIDNGTLIMVASLQTIAQAFGLHKDAIKRISSEVERDGVSNGIKRVRFEIREAAPAVSQIARDWQRYATALDMRLDGRTLNEIGDHFGVSRQRAQQMIQTAKAQLAYRVFRDVPRPLHSPMP